MKARSMATATPSRPATIAMSLPARRRERRPRRPRAGGVAGASELARSGIATGRSSAGEDGLLLILDILHQAVDVVGVVDEALQRRDHHRAREVRSRVAV